MFVYYNKDQFHTIFSLIMPKILGAKELKVEIVTKIYPLFYFINYYATVTILEKYMRIIYNQSILYRLL